MLTVFVFHSTLLLNFFLCFIVMIISFFICQVIALRMPSMGFYCTECMFGRFDATAAALPWWW